MLRSKFQKLVRQFPFLREVAPTMRMDAHETITEIFVQRIDVNLLGCVGREHATFEDYRISFFVVNDVGEVYAFKRERVGIFEGKELVITPGERIGDVLGRCIICDLREITAIVREDWYANEATEKRYIWIYLQPRIWQTAAHLLTIMERERDLKEKSLES